jgi:predicted amidohydrolase YtcJ
MNKHLLLAALLLILVSITACQTSIERPVASAIFSNGTIYTAGTSIKTAEALAIADGKIVFVGDKRTANQLIGPQTQIVDLNGGMLLPGLIDAHLHPVRGAIKELYHCNFPFTSSPQDIQNTVAKCVGDQADSDWIIGGQWDSAFFDRFEIASPRELLDEVSMDKVVFLQDDSLHNAWVNSRALEIAGINRNTPDPEGGTIMRDANGEPNGVLLETAAIAMGELRQRYSADQQQAAVKKFVRDANAFGLTGAKAASSHSYEIAAIQAVDLQHALTLHMGTSMRTPDGKRSQTLDYQAFEKARDKYSSPHLDTRFIKIFLDGVPTPARTAAMLAPYVDDDSHAHGFDGGELLVDPQTLTRDVIEFDKRGFTVKMHAAGDRSVRLGLDAIEAARSVNGNSGLRHELAHAGYISKQDIPRFKELNAVADLSPILWYPSPIMDAIFSAVGKKRGQYYFPVRDLIDAGANLLAGSDWPAVSINANPWVGIESLVSRQDPRGNIAEALWPEQAITLAEAIRIYSIDGAYAIRKEAITGSLETGKSADFIVLQENLFEIPLNRISEVLPLQTWFEGRLVYQRDD